MIEALTSMAVTASLTLAALPTFTHALNRNSLAEAVNEMNLAIALGRSEAMARGERVALVPLRGSDWSSGWYLFVDRNNDGQHDGGEETIRVFEPSNSRLQYRAWGAQANATMSFTTEGYLRRAGNNGVGSGLALGGIAISTGDQVRTICFAAARTRVTNASSCT